MHRLSIFVLESDVCIDSLCESQSTTSLSLPKTLETQEFVCMSSHLSFFVSVSMYVVHVSTSKRRRKLEENRQESLSGSDLET